MSMVKVIGYTTHDKPFRVLVPSSGRVLEFGTAPQEIDLGTDEMAAVRQRMQQGAPLEIVPLSKRAAIEIDDVAGKVAAAEARGHELEATLGGRIAELEAELDQVHERADAVRKRAAQDIAELEEHGRVLTQRVQELAADLSAAQRRTAELEEGARTHAAELEEGARTHAQLKKELDEARARIARIEGQGQKKR